MRLRAVGVLLLACTGLILYLLLSGDGSGRGERETTEREATVPETTDHREPPTPSPAEDEHTQPMWAATGRVTAEDGTLVDGGSVRILTGMGATKKMLAVASFEGSDFTVLVPRLSDLSEIQRTAARVYAEVAARGFVRGRSGGVAPAARMQLDVALNRGAVLTGRILDPAGNPVPDASVWFSPKELNAGTSTDEAGHFALPVTTAAEYWICARKGDVGVAVQGPVRLGPTADHHAGDLSLRGPGTLGGIAVYPDGKPVRRMTLHAVPAKLKDEEITSYPVQPFDAARDPQAATGLRWGWARTGKDGRFAIRGLRTGSYFFLRDRERTLYETGSEARVVIDLRRILVSVRDEDGTPVHGMSMSAEGDSGSVAGEFGEVRALVGDSWTFKIGSRTVQPASSRVDINQDTYEYETTLVARPVRDAGRLIVRALDPRGDPMPNVRVTLRFMPDDNLILYERRIDADGRTVPVPPGRYHLEANPGRDPFALYFAARSEVTVRAGEDTPVTVQAKGGGRVRLTFRTEGVDEQKALPQVNIEVRSGGERLPLGSPLRRTKKGWILGGKWRWNEPTLAWRLMEPGSYELWFKVEGYRPLRSAAIMRAEEVTDVEVRLERSE